MSIMTIYDEKGPTQTNVTFAHVKTLQTMRPNATRDTGIEKAWMGSVDGKRLAVEETIYRKEK